MKPCAIIYSSNTGHTAQYARMLGEQTSLAVYPLDEGLKLLEPGSPVIYLGWLYASCVKGYKSAAKHFSICAVCGVGLCDTGCLLDEVRKATALPQDMPLFTLQGGMDSARLNGLDKLLIGMLKKGLSATKRPSAQDMRMLELLEKDASYVSLENLSQVLAWYKA